MYQPNKNMNTPPPHSPNVNALNPSTPPGNIFYANRGTNPTNQPVHFYNYGPTFVNVFCEPGKYKLNTQMSGNMARSFGYQGNRHAHFAGQHANQSAMHAQSQWKAGDIGPRMPVASTPHPSTRMVLFHERDDSKNRYFEPINGK